MNFDLTSEQLLLRESVQSFVARECTRDLIRHVERERRFPSELWAKLADLGLLALAAPPNFDGEGAGAVEQALVVGELARRSVALAVAYVNTACLAAPLLAAYAFSGREQVVSDIIAGRMLVSFAWTEPSSGSDVLAMRAVARRDADGNYVLSGSKTFITLAAEASEILVVARTGTDDSNRSYGLSCFLVPAGVEGLSIHALGKVGQLSAPFAEVFLDDVVVPSDRLIGDEHEAWRQLARFLKGERVLFAALCLGIAREAFSAAVDYSETREAFGRTIAHFQAIQHHVADMKTSIDAAELLVYRAAWLISRGREASIEATQALMVAATAAGDVTDRGMQILGGASYTDEFDMERYWRDARAFRLSPVTTEVAKNIIARGVGLPRSY